MQTLNVDLGDRSYPIFVGSGLIENTQLLLPYVAGQQVMIVTNDTIAPLYLEKAKALFPGKQVDTVILPDGEAYKDLTHLNLIYDALLEKRHNRKTTLVALGGGVIGDMTGYAAASYQRGVDFIQIPTTLLSQVDSSVGGKTGVNHRLGKNMIGAFHQPRCVVIDIDTLSTLPDRELSAGIAEVIKYGLITDYVFMEWLENNMSGLLAREQETLVHAVITSCSAKADVVAQDEKEGGIRAILNLGHTYGHAIETHQGYGKWLHGEAVATGMVMAADLSQRLGWIDKDDFNRAKSLISLANLPTQAPEGMQLSDFKALMAVDKKVVDGKLRLVLLEALGKAVIASQFDLDEFEVGVTSFVH